MANEITQLADVLVPEVFSDMLSAKLDSKIQMLKYLGVDSTLVGVPGTTITYPAWAYSGDAKDIAEGVAVEDDKLTYTSIEVTIKKVMKSIAFSDEAVISSYGNVEQEAYSQILKAFLSKMQADALALALTSTNTYDAAGIISYDGIVGAIDLFNEEVNTQKVMFINPHQVKQLRLDENFLSADKYGAGMNVIQNGEIGRIANTSIVVSKLIVANAGSYYCPIIKLTFDTETEKEAKAITVVRKRAIRIELARSPKSTETSIVANEFYGVGITDASKLAVVKFLTVAAGA